MSREREAARPSSTSAPRNKLVIRRLPPTLPEDVFWNSIEPWISGGQCMWKRFIKGRSGEGFDGHAIHSRAYVLMASDTAIGQLHRNYDGHVFRSKTGGEYQAVVEYAPAQKTPYKSKVKTDARQGTVEDDPDFQSFLQSMNAPLLKPALEASIPAPQPTSTPLLDHLRSHGRTNKSRSKGDTSSSAGLRAAAVVDKGDREPSGLAGGSAKSKQSGKGPDTTMRDAVRSNGGLKKGKKKGRTASQGSSDGRAIPVPTVPPASAFPSLTAQVPPQSGRTSPLPSNARDDPPHIASTPIRDTAQGSSSSIPLKADSTTGNMSSRGRGGRGSGRGEIGVARGVASSTRLVTSDSQDHHHPVTSGRGRGRGRGVAGPERSPQGAIVQILSRNADNNRGRGRGIANGAGGGPTPPSQARIDM